MTPAHDDPSSSAPPASDLSRYSHVLVRPQILTRVLPLPKVGAVFTRGIFLASLA